MRCTAINLFVLVCGLLAAGSVAWGAVPVPIDNAGFENPAYSNGAWNPNLPSWTEGWYQLPDTSAWVEVLDSGAGAYNVNTSAYTSGLAPEGENMAYTVASAGYDRGINQVLAGFTSPLQADATYVLSATVGNPYLYNGGLAPDHRIELVAGGVVLDSVTGASPVDDTTWATPSLTYNSGAAPAQLGEQLEIRLIAVNDPRDDGYEVDYDAISLNATYSHPISDPNGPYGVIPAGSVTLDGSGSIPSDGSNISSYDWDLDNDGQFDDFTGVSGAFSRHELVTTYGMTSGGNTIGLRVTDESPAAGTATSSTLVVLGGGLEGELGILSPETLAGINPATGAPWAAGDQYRLAFFSSERRTAESTDIEVYNAWAQELANDSTAYDIGADEGATWKVIGSTNEVDAIDNTSTTWTEEEPGDPIFLLDGSTIVANDFKDLWDGDIQNIINLTEQGVVDTYWPYTGTHWDGTKAPGHGMSFAALGGGGQIHQGRSDIGTEWIWRMWTGDPPDTLLNMYALSDPLVIVPLGMTWNGGEDNWAAEKWDDGGGLPLVGPAPDMAMIIDHPDGDSVVTVATDFTTAVGGGPAASVAVGEFNTASLIVNSAVTLEVTNEVAVGHFGTLNVDGTLAAANVTSNGTLSGSGTINADFITDGIVAPGGSTGMLTFQAAFELGDDATCQCEIGPWDSENVPDPWDPVPPTGPVNDKLHVSADDALLSGALNLNVLGKLSPPHPLPDNPEVMVEWYGDQTRTLVSTEGERSIRYTFNSVPEAQPEQWYIRDIVDPDTGEIIHERNWEQGHLAYGVFLTRLGDGGANTQFPPDPLHYGFSYLANATQAHLFQAASGDTNGDRILDSEDVQNILGFGEYLTGVPCDWPEGDFNGSDDPDDPELPGLAVNSIGLCDSYDIQLLLATALWPPTDPPTPYATPPGGKPAEGEVKLLVVPREDGTFGLEIDAGGLPLTSYAIHSADGALSGQQAANLGLFTQDDDFVIAGAGLSTLLDGVHDLGAVIGPGFDGLEGLSLTYTVQGAAGLYGGQVVMVPEPGTLAMLIAGGLGLLLAVRRRRRTA